jgi:hypothetical protein
MRRGGRRRRGEGKMAVVGEEVKKRRKWEVGTGSGTS